MKNLYHEVSEGYGRVSLQSEGEMTYDMRCPNDPGTWEVVKEHLPRPITADMRKRGNEALGVFLFGMPKKKGKREAYCTACGKTFEVGDKYEHKTDVTCPKCKREATYFESWRGRGKCVVANYHAFWAKSRLDNTVFQVGVICERDFTNSITAKPEYILTDITMFREKRAPAKFHAVFRYAYGYHISRSTRPCASVYTCGGGYYNSLRMPHFDCNKTLAETARGTQLERCGVGTEHFKCLEDSWKLYELVALAMRYPSVEYLYKMGQKNLISEVIRWGQKETYINLNGKTAKDVLGLPPQVLSEVKKRKTVLDRDIMRARSVYEQRNESYDLDDLLAMAYGGQDFDAIVTIGKQIGLSSKRIVGYIERQGPRARGSVARDWRDYLQQCETLGMNLADEAVSMPKNLDEAHREMNKRIEYMKNTALNDLIAMRAARLKHLVFESDGILMRPFKSAEEIIDEGTALNHCVGGYCKRYADGGTILCAIRRAQAPDTPWHTVEFSARTEILVQCRGYENRTKPEDKPLLDAFWAAFEEHRTKKVRKTA